MPYQIIGRVTDFKGKSLWEIIGNLKKFGIGRAVNRNMFERYSEPTYIKILKVEALNAPEPSFEGKRKVIALVQKTFRGMTVEKPVQMESATYKSDYFLIHKRNESRYFAPQKPSVTKIMPKEMELPPLIKEYLNQQRKIKGLPITAEPKMQVVYNKTGVKRYKVEDGTETISKEKLSIGLGTPVTSRLYDNIVE